jgi:hypothetical protein
MSPTGDLNTGMWFPAADTIAFSEGGVEALRIDSSGNVGIGTSSPDRVLHLNNSGTEQNVRAKFTNGTTGEGASDGFEIGINASNPAEVVLVNYEASPMAFFTSGSERMRVTSGGTLQIAGGGNDNVGEINMGNTAQNASRFQVRHQSSAWYLKTVDSEPLILGTANTERMRIDSSGNVGIGTSSPTSYAGYASLALNNATNGGVYDILKNDTRVASFFSSDVTTTLASITSIPLAFRTANTERMRIDSSGRVLIGITTARDDFYQNDVAPSLQVEGSNTSTASISATQNAASADGPRIFLGKTRGTGAQIVSDGDRLGALTMQGADGTDLVPSAEINGFVDGTPGANDMPGRLQFSTTADGASSPTERMRISANGAMLFDVESGGIMAMRVGTSAGGATDCFEINLSGATFACYVDVVTNQSAGYAGRTSQFLWYARRAPAGNSRGTVELSTNSLGSVNAGVVAVATITASATNPTGTLERFQITTDLATDSIYCIIRAIGNIPTLKILN